MKTVKNLTKYLVFALVMTMLFGAFSMGVGAADEAEALATVTEAAEAAEGNVSGMKALAAAITMGLAAAAGALGMGMAIAKSVEGISRQPEAEGKIRTSLMLGLVFVETAIIYALIIAVLIIFVL